MSAMKDQLEKIQEVREDAEKATALLVRLTERVAELLCEVGADYEASQIITATDAARIKVNHSLRFLRTLDALTGDES